MQGDETPKTLWHDVQGSAQLKELYAIVLALSEIQEHFNLFIDSLYAANLLPNFPWSYTKLDDNPITPFYASGKKPVKVED